MILGINYLEKKQMITYTEKNQMQRDLLLKKAGHMVIVYYLGVDEEDCFAIGWFYAMDETELFLKVTSTKFETYENIKIEIDRVSKIDDYRHD